MNIYFIYIVHHFINIKVLKILGESGFVKLKAEEYKLKVWAIKYKSFCWVLKYNQFMKSFLYKQLNLKFVIVNFLRKLNVYLNYLFMSWKNLKYW